MVSNRCIMAVNDELTNLGFQAVKVVMGEAEITEPITDLQYEQIRMGLVKLGFELLNDKKDILIQKIKNTIIELVHYSEEPLIHNLSAYLSGRLGYDYTYMSNQFSERSGITIEKFYICHKIERVKELLLYNELTLTEIAYKMHYSSVAHLSNQFKKVSGLTTSRFKKLSNKNRSFLEDL